MNRRRTISGFVAVLVAGMLLAAPPDVFACSPGSAYNINQNDVIAEGWVENVEIAESATRDMFLPGPRHTARPPILEG